MMNHNEYTSLWNLQKKFLLTGVPFVTYQLPGSHQPVTLLTHSPLLRLEPDMPLPQGKPGFIMAPFNPDDPKVWLSTDRVLTGTMFPVKNSNLFTEPDFLSQPDSQPQALPPSLPSTTSKEVYQYQLENILKTFHQGDLKKVVLSRVINIPFVSQQMAPSLFDVLIHKYPEAFVYLLSFPGYGAWLGASPELLLAAQSNGPALTSIETMALAGTRKAVTGEATGSLADGKTENTSIIGSKEQITEPNWGEKEKDEHLWVSNYIMQQLKDTGCSNISVSDTHTAQAGNVQHLRTDFKALIHPHSIPNLIHKLHPTPAVCGWPKLQALQMIRNTEKHDRSYYSGYLGPVNQELLSPSREQTSTSPEQHPQDPSSPSQETLSPSEDQSSPLPEPSIKLYVNLRCMQLNGQRAVIYVGSGITEASDAGDEWDETTHKSLTLLTEIEKLSNE
ncbi:MAG: chorismate-binding protein [Lentimicrobiaceae bacterium]